MGRKIQGPKNREIWYTCSPGHVRKYLKDLSPQQKDYVIKIGFGSFLSMADFELDKDLTLWLFQRFNCKTECLEFEGGISIPVRPLVKSVLGIPSGPIKVVERSYFDPAVYRRYYVGHYYSRGEGIIGSNGKFLKRVKYTHIAGKQICSETEEKHFCISFMMAIIALYLAPNKNSTTGKHFFGAVQQVDKLSQMDWCDFTASYLFEGIKEFKQYNCSPIKVKGCVHILSVIFIDLVKNAGLKIPGGFPRICIVNTQHKELVNSCSPQVHRLEESVYASMLDKTLKDQGRNLCRNFGRNSGNLRFSIGNEKRSAEMSNLVKCVFYYGSGTVQINELGADLSGFQYEELDLTAPQTWSVDQLKDWLAKCLGLNPETYTVGVHALWTGSSSNIFWFLRPIDKTSQWVGWLKGCERRGTNPIALVLPVAKEVNPPEGEGGYDPGQSSEGMHLSNSNYVSNAGGGGYESGQSSQAVGGHDDSGEADGDEVNGHMQNLMEDEDAAGADQFGTTVEDTTCISTELMVTHHYSAATRFHKEGVYSRGTRKQPQDPLKHGRSILGASQKKLGTAISSSNKLSLAIVEPTELDTSTPSAAPSFFTESASHEETHTRQESLIIMANADSTHHHSVEEEHISFPRDGQQVRSNGPSSEPYEAQIDEGVQVAPDVSLGGNRASPSMMEDGGQSAKKARVEQSSGHVEPAGVGAVVDTSLLNCPVCSRPFKPPVFQCKGGHLACGTCLAELPDMQCQKCEHGGAFDIHNMMMDTIVLSAKIKCSYDGCQSYVSYHELDDHQSTCPCAPCFCTEPGCGFVGLPLALLGHLTNLHSWPVHSIEYGKELRLQVPVSEPRHLLLGEKDDCVFLLVVGAVGQSTATAVSVVRLGACPALQPRYMLNILAYLPPAAASRRAHMLLLDMDVDSSARPGEVAMEELASYLTVPPTYLVGVGSSREISLDIRIDKIVS